MEYENECLKTIKDNSEEKIKIISSILSDNFPSEDDLYKRICIYACGSMGRHEMTSTSDLDLFFILMNNKDESVDCESTGSKKSDLKSKEPFNNQKCTNIEKYNFFSNLHRITCTLNYEDPSKGGEYWDFITESNLLDIGSREEDFNNSFTARLLMILESKPIYNVDAYDKLIDSIVDNKYFRDYKTHSGDFLPLFLMNDIYRYWYTLTLNYEFGRKESHSNNKKNWKRLKLKYARYITCFSMIACLYKPNISPEYVKLCIKMTPFERLDFIADSDESLNEIVATIKSQYSWFIELRNQEETWWDKGENKSNAFCKAEEFHRKVKEFLKNVSKSNLKLYEKSDMF